MGVTDRIAGGEENLLSLKVRKTIESDIAVLITTLTHVIEQSACWNATFTT
jgi:hypothetical protein